MSSTNNCSICDYPYNIPKNPEQQMFLCPTHSMPETLSLAIHSILYTQTSDTGELFYHVVLADAEGCARHFWESGATRWVSARRTKITLPGTGRENK